jgi:hypothetical protein
MVPATLPPGTPRPEPYGFPLKEGNYFRADDDLSVWERYIGWHDWAVLLNGELGQLYVTARACSEGRHPVDHAADGEGDLSFGEQLVARLPQFFLCVWELELNGWSRLVPADPVSRVLLEVRGGRPVGSYRSAVDAAFVEAVTLAHVLEHRPDLRESLSALRQRHARHQAGHPWCWLRFFWERLEAFDIFDMLQVELQRWHGNTIATPEQLRCERWHQAAKLRLLDLMGANSGHDWPIQEAVGARCSPGFDWSLQLAGPVSVTDLARQILRSLERYDSPLIVEELANESELFSQWVNCVQPDQERHHLAETEGGDEKANTVVDNSEAGAETQADGTDVPDIVSLSAAPLLLNPHEIDAVLRVAREHIGNWQEFYRRVRLIQTMQIDLLRPIVDSESPYQACVRASQSGEMKQLEAHAAAYNQYLQSDEARQTACPDELLLSYLDLETLRNHDVLGDRLQGLQAEIFHHELRYDHWNTVLEELKGNSAVTNGDLDEVIRTKYLHWQRQCEAIIGYYRTCRDAEVRFTRSFIERLQRQRDTLGGHESTYHKPEDRESQASPRVVLRGRTDGPIVLQKTKKKLTKAQYNVVKALLDAGDIGLTKDQLVSQSGHEDACGILTRLADKDDDWKQVIHFAGQTGGGYRIK